MVQRSKYFLTNTREFLDNWVTLGYDSCHKTDGYDAEKCHQDCKMKEKSDFAKQCRTDGGLYKCCIRSDNKLFHPNWILANYLFSSDETKSSATSAGTAAPSLSAPQQEDQHIYTPIRRWRRCNLKDNLMEPPLQFLDFQLIWECTRAMIFDVWNQRMVFP